MEKGDASFGYQKIVGCPRRRAHGQVKIASPAEYIPRLNSSRFSSKGILSYGCRIALIFAMNFRALSNISLTRRSVYFFVAL